MSIFERERGVLARKVAEIYEKIINQIKKLKEANRRVEKEPTELKRNKDCMKAIFL